MVNKVHRLLLPSVICALMFFSAASINAMDVDREYEFARGLVDQGLPDYAMRVLDRVLERHPDQRERVLLVRAEVRIAQRRFDDAEKLLAELPAGQPQAEAIRLAIGSGHARMGNIDRAREVYDEFFDRYEDRVPDDPDLLRVYQEATYEFGQLLERVGDLKGAAESYRRTIASELEEPGAERRLMTDLARLYLSIARDSSGNERDEFLDKSQEMAAEIQWGGQDLWFARSIPILAYVELERGNESRARSLIREHMETMRTIDRQLREQNFPMAQSPMATVRFLLGDLYERQFKEMREQGASEGDLLRVLQSALTEYYNVFARYGGSEWGPEAGIRGQALVDMLEEEYGRSVNIDFGELLGEAVQAQFRMGDDLFRQGRYDEAIREYLRMVNTYPEEEPSLRALSNLLLAYLRTGDDLHADMMVEYLAERFSGSDIAARAILAAANHYRTEVEDEEKYMAVYETYISHFPQHERAPRVMFDLARLKESESDIGGAHEFYQRIIETYPRHEFALRARFARAWAYYQVEDYEQAVEQFAGYVDEAPPGHDKVRAQYLLADSHRRAGEHREAISGYNQVIQWAGNPDSPYNARPEDAERNRPLLERANFYIGFGLGRISEPEDRVPDFRERAISAYDRFLGQYPESNLAPRAMFDKGQIQVGLGRSRDAAETFEELARTYPDSTEGQSALFALVDAAIENEMYDIARDAFQDMMASPEAYSPVEFTRVGQRMLDAGLFETVIPAYERVVDTTDDDGLLQRALFGLGQANIAQDRYDDAVDYLTRLFDQFPQTPFYYDAKFAKAEAHRGLGQYREAQNELRDILRFSDDAIRNQRAEYKVGLIQREAGEKDRALGTFVTIGLLMDPGNRDFRPIIEDSLIAAIELSMETERYDDVEELSEHYLNVFPRGGHVDFVREQRREGRRRAVAGGGGAS